MNRLTPWVVAAVTVAVSLAGICTVAWAHRGPDVARPLQEFDVRLYMSDRPDGAPRRSFVSDTNRVYAVVAFENASNQRYRVRLRDLAGIQVFDDSVTLSGTGEQTRTITIAQFLVSYEQHMQEQITALTEQGSQLASLCQNPPTPPLPTQPPVNPTPGPAPTPGGWARWQTMMLDALESSSTSGTALGQTLQAFGSLPDARDMAGIVDAIGAGQHSLDLAVAELDQAQDKVNPPSGTGPGTPTPDPPPVPDPAGACQLVADAAANTAAAVARGQDVVAQLPADVSTWRLPATSARYDSGQFSSCVQYSTELVQDTYVAATTPWTVGDAGLPALIFPAPDLVDKASLGQLRLRLPEGASALYAQTVDVAGVNRTAEVNGFVTDAMCNPVDGVTMTLAVDKAVAGSVQPNVADVVEGVATGTLTSGITPTLNSAVTGLVCVGPCAGITAPGNKPITAQVRFSVVGPPNTLILHVNPDVINAQKGQRANISVEAKDYYNRKVADGTVIHLRIAPGDPGVLARSVTPTGSRQPELQTLGKEVDLVTLNAFTIVPPGDDPGLVYGTDLYLISADDGFGPVELQASWGAIQAAPALVTIVSRRLIFLPIVMKGYDVLATPPYSTTPVAPAVSRVTPEP